VLKILNCLFKQLAHSSNTHQYNTRQATRGLFTVPRSRIEVEKHTVQILIGTTQDMQPEVSSVPRSRIEVEKHTVQILIGTTQDMQPEVSSVPRSRTEVEKHSFK
jgi:hypothetical protein